MSSDICMRTLCVKNLPQPSEKAVSTIFGPYGGVFSRIITSTDTNRKDTLVDFESEEQASKARNDIHGKTIDGLNLYVDYAIFPQASISSPSSNKPQKQKISVLDRIIKPSNPKYPKLDDKNANPETQGNGKEVSVPDSKNGGTTPQTKKTFESKPSTVSQSPQYSIIKRNEVAEKAQGANGGSDAKGNKNENVPTKKAYTTQKKEKSNQKFYDGPKKLEIIRPRQDEVKLSNDPVDFSKAINSIMRDNPELAKPVFEFVQKKAINSVNEAPSKALDRNDHYGSSNNKTVSRSRSRTSKGRNIASDSHSRYNSYNHASPRRSRSRSSHRSRRSIQRGHSRSRSHGRDRPPYSREPSHPNHRDPYHDRRSPVEYRDPYYSRRSRSKSPRRRDYSPHREEQVRRDDPRYDYRERSRTRSRSRSRSRSGYYRHNNPDYYSQSNSDKNRNYNKSVYYSSTGLVIEKRNDTRMYDDRSYDRDVGQYRPRGYSRSRSRDRLNPSSRRSRSRERQREREGERPSRNGWTRSPDRSGYTSRKSPERPRPNKGLDMRRDSRVEKNQKKSVSNLSVLNDISKNQHREKQRDAKIGVKSTKQENLGPASKMQYPNQYSNAQDLKLGVNNANQIYNSYAGHANLQNYFPPDIVNFASSFVPYPNQSQDTSLPAYMYPPSASITTLDLRNVSLIPQGTQIQSIDPQSNLATNQGQFTEITTMPTIHQEPNPILASKQENLPQKEAGESVEPSTIENSTTEYSNDLAKPDDKAIPEDFNGPEQKEELNQKETSSPELPPGTLEMIAEGTKQGFSINDMIKKNNKIQGIINYLITTGDYQGLKEKIKSLEKSK